MPRLMQSVYVESEQDAKRVTAALKKLKKEITSLDWDGAWDEIQEEVA